MYIVVKSLPLQVRQNLGVSSGAAAYQLCNLTQLINLFGPQFLLL